jgi:hypothetical protein
MFKSIIKFFRKTACGAFPLIFLDVLHIAYFIYEGVIFLIFKYLRPLIFWKSHGIPSHGISFREKRINPGEREKYYQGQ